MNAKRVRQQIEDLELGPVIKKAQELFGLESSETAAAEREFRHFLYLVHWNKRERNSEYVVPTRRADKIWHAAILFTNEYAAMCEDLYRSFLHHQPGLEEGSPELDTASIHTKALHDRVTEKVPGFDLDYFSFITVPTAVAAKAPPKSSSKSEGSSNSGAVHVGDCGSDLVDIDVSERAPSFSSGSSSSSDFSGGGGGFGGGGASSCGGGGCGGCGG